MVYYLWFTTLPYTYTSQAPCSVTRTHTHFPPPPPPPPPRLLAPSSTSLSTMRSLRASPPTRLSWAASARGARWRYSQRTRAHITSAAASASVGGPRSAVQTGRCVPNSKEASTQRHPRSSAMAPQMASYSQVMAYLFISVQIQNPDSPYDICYSIFPIFKTQILHM